MKYNNPNTDEKGEQRLFAQMIYSSGKIEVVRLGEFGNLLEGIFSGEEEVFKNIVAIQAYRSETTSREIYAHMMEYKDGRYYSVIKNGNYSRIHFIYIYIYIESGKKVFDITLEKQLLVNTKIVINCIETSRRYT